MKKGYLFLADGFEEVEGLTVADLLRRAKLEVVMVSVGKSRMVTGSHGIRVEADCLFEEMKPEEGEFFVLPGGMPGTLHLKEHAGLKEVLLQAAEQGKRIAAICAAPSVLGAFGLLEGKKAVCYPGFEDKLTGAQYVPDEVVEAGTITTSRGLGTAIPFGLSLVAQLTDQETSEKLAEAICYRQR